MPAILVLAVFNTVFINPDIHVFDIIFLTVEPQLSEPQLSGLFSLVPIFSWILICCNCRKQCNNPFKRLLKQRIIPYAFQNLQVRWDKELFRCIQLIYMYDWLNYIQFNAKGVSCLISSLRMGFHTRDRLRLKLKTCLRSESELFYQLKMSR